MHVKKERIYASTKAIRRGTVELASLNKKEEKRKKEGENFYHRLVQDVDDNFQRCIPVENHMQIRGLESLKCT